MPPGAFHLTWLGVDATITEADGTEHFISPETLGPFDSSKFSQDGNARLTVVIVNRERRFEKGERISVPARSLQEICAMTAFTYQKLQQLTLNWLLEQGISVNGGKPAPEPTPSLSLLCDVPE